LAFFAQTTTRFSKNWIITLVFEKNANCFAEKWQKSQKIGKNRRKLAKIAENWQKSQKIGKNRRKL
jgi:hypothetical protein